MPETVKLHRLSNLAADARLALLTRTEAAGMGAAGAILIAFARGALTWSVMLEVARETTLTTAKQAIYFLPEMHKS